MDKITSLCKRRGFIFPGSEIYGGLGGTWDYGTLGAFMRDNIRAAWKKRFVQGRDDMEYVEGAVLMASRVWEASGHAAGFNDLLVECKKCHERFRADHLDPPILPERSVAKSKGRPSTGSGTKLPKCPQCGAVNWTESHQFNMMFETYVGPVKDEDRKTYLRPETAQSMFTNFKNIMESGRRKPPFGIAQIGKSFRNEIQTGNFIFRSRELEIAEIEYFVKPGEDDKWFDVWLKEWEKFYVDHGINKKNLRRFEHPRESLAHYSKRTVDLEYKFPFGWGELAGVANRTDYDLKRHIEYSGVDLSILDDDTRRSDLRRDGDRISRYIPYVIEPTLGIDRALVTFLIDAYDEVKGGRTTTTESNKEVEVVLRLHKDLAPIKVAVLPLSKKEPLVKIAQDIAATLRPHFAVAYDEVASIGRRYRRQDEIGTPYCVTVDFESLEDKKVTVRDRDTMKQERVMIGELREYLSDKFITIS